MDIREDLNIYMQIIRLLDESVNGYLYACDLQDDRMYLQIRSAADLHCLFRRAGNPV